MDRAGIAPCGRGRSRPIRVAAGGLDREGYPGGGVGRVRLKDPGRWYWRRFVGVVGGRRDRV